MYYDYGWSQLAGPLGILGVFIVVFMALGVVLIDRLR